MTMAARAAARAAVRVAVETGVAAGVMAGGVRVVGAEEEMGKAVAVALARAVVVVHLLRWRLY